MSAARLLTSVGDLPILSGGFVLSLRGNWTGTFVLHSPTAPAVGSPATLRFVRETGGVDVFNGTVRRAATAVGEVGLSVTVVGGKGLLLADLPPRDHAPGTAPIPAGLIAAGIVGDAGEQLAAGVETALDAATVPRWTRFATPGRDALDLLVDALGWGWRVLADGAVWAGPETWPAVDITKFLQAIPDDAGATYACDGAPVRPGTTVTTPDGALRVVEAVYAIAASSTRVTIRAAAPGDPPPARAGRELYLATYAATVDSQDADGSLVVVPDDPRLGSAASPLRGVALRCGIPGARIVYQAPAGERVRIAFEGGDPRGAYAEACDQTGATVHGVARVGDQIQAGTLAGIADPVTGVVVFTYTLPGGAPTAGPTVNLGGVIFTGSPEIRIR